MNHKKEEDSGVAAVRQRLFKFEQHQQQLNLMLSNRLSTIEKNYRAQAETLDAKYQQLELELSYKLPLNGSASGSLDLNLFEPRAAFATALNNNDSEIKSISKRLENIEKK